MPTDEEVRSNHHRRVRNAFGRLVRQIGSGATVICPIKRMWICVSEESDLRTAFQTFDQNFVETDGAPELWNVEDRGIEVARYRWRGETSCFGKIIDRSCLDNYGYPMRRAYLQFHGAPPPSKKVRYPPDSCIWSRWSIAATDSRNYIRLTAATNNYPRATFVPSGDSRDPSKPGDYWTYYHLISRYKQ